jgi:hypothetical protein
VRLRWNGDRVLRNVQDAVAHAIDETTEDAARAASASRWWRSRTGNLESQIEHEPAKRRGSKIRGRFGTTRSRGFYGLYLERRTPFLRPAADRVFPTLAGRIRRRLSR